MKGTVFVLVERNKKEDSYWYNYRTPNGESGFVSIPGFTFKVYTEEERYVSELRKKDREEFIKATRDIFIT